MTQTEFAEWLDNILGAAPIEEMVSDEVRAHMDRVYLANEERAWGFAHEEARESYQITLRGLCKMMFAVGYDSGREQAQMDGMFGGGSGMFDDDSDTDSGDDPRHDRGSDRGSDRLDNSNLDGALPI